MIKYDSKIHHRRSIRLKGYDYSQSGLYFITLCVQGGACLLGEIVNGKMCVSGYGGIVSMEWENTINVRKNIVLHTYIVMPNHFHAIIEIVGRDELHSNKDEIHSNKGELHSNKGEIHSNKGEIHSNKGECNSPLRSPKQTIGAIVRGFKGAVSKQIGYSLWQRNYYEHIIRNEQSYRKISEYIINNPANWNSDRLNSGAV